MIDQWIPYFFSNWFHLIMIWVWACDCLIHSWGVDFFLERYLSCLFLGLLQMTVFKHFYLFLESFLKCTSHINCSLFFYIFIYTRVYFEFNLGGYFICIFGCLTFNLSSIIKWNKIFISLKHSQLWRFILILFDTWTDKIL